MSVTWTYYKRWWNYFAVEFLYKFAKWIYTILIFFTWNQWKENILLVIAVFREIDRTFGCQFEENYKWCKGLLQRWFHFTEICSYLKTRDLESKFFSILFCTPTSYMTTRDKHIFAWFFFRRTAGTLTKLYNLFAIIPPTSCVQYTKVAKLFSYTLDFKSQDCCPLKFTLEVLNRTIETSCWWVIVETYKYFCHK